jgi:hypothetical protein
MKSLLLVLLATGLFIGCGKASDRSKAGGSQEFQEYGKPGPGSGEACYVGPAEAAHTCTEAMVGDKESIKILNTYCANSGGQRGKGSCKTAGHIGTCRYMPNALNLKLRFYGQTFPEARTDCEREGGQLFSAY